MTINKALMQETFDDSYNEEWMVVVNNGGKYVLNRLQAKILQDQIAKGNRGIVMFNGFSIPIAYIVEFYITRRFRKGQKRLTTRSEVEHKKMPLKDWEKFKKEVYKKLKRK